MSRLPPKIKQKINGEPVSGYSVKPIALDAVTYSIDSHRRQDDDGKIIGMDWILKAVDDHGVLLWQTTYYALEFDLMLETDVQESYPIDFVIEEGYIVIRHEYGVVITVDLNGSIIKKEVVTTDSEDLFISES